MSTSSDFGEYLDVTKRVSDRTILRWKSGQVSSIGDSLIVERALSLCVDGETLAVLMRTPGHDIELVRGLLWSEGVIRGDGEPVTLSSEGPDQVSLTMSSELLEERWAVRDFIASSACGVCGVSALADLEDLAEPILSDTTWSPKTICEAPAKMGVEQFLFDKTGAVHSAALLSKEGELVQCREDVGRHNAVDKLVGWAISEARLPLSESLLLVSSRLSYEIVHKAICAGIPTVLGVSAPTSLAVDMAERWRVTLVGFVRGNGFNVYSHGYRIAQ